MFGRGREERADEGLELRSREEWPVYTARRLDTTGYLNGNSLFGLATGSPLGTGSLDDRRREQMHSFRGRERINRKNGFPTYMTGGIVFGFILINRHAVADTLSDR